MSDDFSQQLMDETLAIRLRRSQFGVRRSIKGGVHQSISDSVSADKKFISASKKLLDTRNQKYRAVTAIMSAAASTWKDSTIPYPEDGIRLIRRDAVQAFSDQMTRYQQQLDQALAALDEEYQTLRWDARERLGDLFDPNDYPGSITGEFTIDWEPVTFDTAEYLRELSPRLYEEQCRRIQSRFDEAVQMAEQAFMDEFQKLVAHLTERLTPGDDGRIKQFKPSTIENLSAFFDRFSALSVRSNRDLDALVATAQELVSDCGGYDSLHDSEGLRNAVRIQMERIQGGIDELIVNKPSRAFRFDD
ncbi:hypothetical protein [Lignipirellula cremea]|uniref:Uncharacterized protein n=1 Tax=Lignipirellula cremea TaxID=2528010 RepID=A0A518DTK1_9BACT|nr:hypothetical protein [Lignipirellula cremea]QDU95171.1 hypothetical protein Pla8534_29830 [Lignipirellula cremea]